jgi:hypothetical protein
MSAVRLIPAIILAIWIFISLILYGFNSLFFLRGDFQYEVFTINHIAYFLILDIYLGIIVYTKHIRIALAVTLVFMVLTLFIYLGMIV